MEIYVRFEGLSQPYPPGLDDKLQLYFQSRKKSGGGDINFCNICAKDKDVFAIIMFDKPESVQSVLKRGHHELNINGQKIGLMVEPANTLEDEAASDVDPSMSERCSPEKIPSPSRSGSEIGHLQHDELGHDQQHQSGCGHDQQVFSHNPHHQQGNVNDPHQPGYSHDHQQGWSHDQEHQQGYRHDQQHQQNIFEETEYVVHDRDSMTEDDQPTDHSTNESTSHLFLEVLFDPKLSDDTVMMYFESEKHSGGDSTANFKLVEPGKMYITFDKPEIAERVSTRSHVLEKKTLEVSLMEEKLPSPNTVEVTGFPPSIDIDILEMYFENKKRSDGGETVETSMNTDKNVFTIMFAETAVSEQVLQRAHQLGKSRLTVKRPGKVVYRKKGTKLSKVDDELMNLATLTDDDDDNDLHVLVCFEALSVETVVMYFESKRRSKGGEILKHDELQPGNLVIKYKEPGVAEKVCSKSHHLEGQILKVSLIKETDPTPNTIEVRGFSSLTGEDSLELYFENKRSGGEEIVESYMNDERSIFTIRYSNDAVVNRVLQRTHKLGNQQLKVQRPQKTWQHKHTDPSLVEVHGVAANTTAESLEMYFESRRSGADGSEVKATYHKDRDVWTVKFDNSTIVDSVIKKTHRLNKRDIKVFRPQPKMVVLGKPTKSDAKKEKEESVPLEVDGVKESISEEHLRFYFENNKRSSGGPIAFMQRNKKTFGSWIIHFQEPGVAEKVVKHNGHVIGESILKVKLGKKRAKRPSIDNCLLITGLPKKLSDEMFELYLDKVTSKTLPRTNFGRDPSKAIVTYTSPIEDIDNVISRINNEKLQDVRITAKKVYEVDTIIVKNMDKKTTKEFLRLYFENKDRSGGGDINAIQFDTNKMEATIQFVDYKVVKSVLNKKHHLQKKDLEVSLYYDDIGEVVSDGCQWIPDPVSVNVDPYLATFAFGNTDVINNFVGAGIQVEHNSDVPDVVNLHFAEESGFDLTSISDWHDHAVSNFKQFIDKFDIKKLYIGDECFEEFLKFCKSLNTNDVKVIEDDSSPSVMVLGVKDSVEQVFSHLSGELKIRHDEIKRKKNITKKTEQCKPIKIKKIKLLGFEKIAASKLGVELVIDENNNTITFEGLPEAIDTACLSLYKELENITEVSFLCEPVICKFLTDFYDEVIQVQYENKLQIAYGIEGNRVTVYSTSDNQARDAKSDIKKRIKHHKYDLSSDKMKVMNSSDGKIFIDDLKSQKSVIVEVVKQESGSCVMVTGFDVIVSQVVSRLNDFLQTNQILEKRKNIDERGTVHLFAKHHSEEVAAIESDLKMFFVKLTPKPDKSCIMVRGNRSGIVKAIEGIIALESKVKSSKHLISQPGMASFFKEPKGQRALASVENTFKCIIEMDGKFTNSATMQALLRHKSHRGVEFVVCKADMTDMQVDVIVNAANDKLQHVGGLAKAIVDAGGQTIQGESNQKLAAHGGTLRIGEVIVTDAGDLPCKKVIHTVGPRYSTQQSKPMLKRLLMNSVMCAYEEADKLRLSSIAMPAISSGVYGYPLQPCTQAIIEVTKEYFDENPASKLQLVYFISFDINVCKAFETSMKSVFNISQDDDIVRDEDDDDVMVDEDDSDEFTDLSDAASAIPTVNNSGLMINKDVVTTREGIKISLIKGKIEDSKVDVIVNTTSGDFNLNSGAVSKALLQKAGIQLQQECDTFKASGQIPQKGFVETGAAALSCQKVFHTSSQHYQGPSSIQNIKELLKCLFLAALDMKSIAIPALGTGNLQYPADQVARAMYEEAIAFSAKYPQNNLKDIRFVVYHKDSRTITAFDNEIMNLKHGKVDEEGKKLKILKKEQTKAKKDHWTKISAPTGAQIQSPFNGFRRLNNLCAEMDVAGVTVTVEHGDITQNDADAIVNLTSSEFDLKYGAVSKAILKTGGKSIQAECYKNMKSPTDEVWTGPGRLKCSSICHIPVPNDISTLKEMLVRVMTTAKKMKQNTLAFPAIGTGNVGKSPKESALFILDCICSFSMNEKPGNLRNIRIIVYEAPMTLQFISAMEKKEGKPLEQKNLIQKGIQKFGAFVKSWTSGEESNDQSNKTLTLKILSLDEQQIQGAKDSIQSITADELKDKTLHNSIFSQFTTVHLQKLNKIAAKHEVILGTKNIRSNTVELQGRADNILGAQQEVFDLVDKIHREEKEEKEKELILKDVMWYYTSLENEMKEFDEGIVVLLERAHSQKQRKVKYTAANNHTYEVDFKKMKEEDLTSKRICDVVRVELNAGQMLPSTWSTMATNEKLKEVDLTPGSKEYNDIKGQFITSLAGQFTTQSIVKITRIQNIELWKQYAAKKESFAKSMVGLNFERVLYHGTDEGTIQKINNGGFNRSYAGKNATAYGKGTYFAASAGYSASSQYSRPNAKGEKHIFYCHVLVGKCTQGNQTFIAPPAGFDSVADNASNPQIVVIFNDVQAYPSYLITFN